MMFCRSHRPPQLSLLTPEQLNTKEEEVIDPNLNILDLRPDPVYFMRFVKSIDRPDIASDLFLRFLDSYRGLRADKDGDAMRY